MSRKSYQWVYILIMIVVTGSLGVLGGIGCGDNGIGPIGPTPTPTATPTASPTAAPTASPTPSPTPPVDVAMGDVDSDNVYVFLDVLNTMPSSPDVILDNGTSGVNNPVSVVINSDRLFVANGDECGLDEPEIVLIFDGMSALTPSPTPVPDVTLGNLGVGLGLCNVTDIAVADNSLYASNESFVAGTSRVTVYRDVDTVVTQATPDVVLDNGTSLVNTPQSLAVANDILYVCNDPGGSGSDTVTIYNGASTLVAAPTPAPDVTLDNGTSLIDGCLNLRVLDNTLYVVQANGGDEDVLVFDNADALTDSQAPDFIINEGGPFDGNPRDVSQTGARAFLSTEADPPGLLAFDAPIATDDPTPVAELTDPVENCFETDSEQGAVFVACLGADATPAPAVYGYTDASTVVDDQAPDLSMTDASMSEPFSLDAAERPTP